jgi:hypothetical protein
MTLKSPDVADYDLKGSTPLSPGAGTFGDLVHAIVGRPSSLSLNVLALAAAGNLII